MDTTDQRRATGPAARIAAMPTGAKVFVILGVALLPLALIALFVTITTTREADVAARRQLNEAANESARMLDGMLDAHVRTLRTALRATERGAADGTGCSLARGTFLAMADEGAGFMIADGAGRPLCGERLAIAGASVLGPGELQALVVEDGLAIRIGGATGASATAFYPARVLRTRSAPSGFLPDYASAIMKHGDAIELHAMAGQGLLLGKDSTRRRLSVGDLEFEMAMRGPPITSPLIIATVLLLLMWLAAAGIGWAVVDVLLIRPLRQLRKRVGAFRPGEEIDAAGFGAMPAQEIRDLAATFGDISRTVNAHEADLAEGLVRQTRLTREVHHRVKNNLQVIASLINFHARAAAGPDAAEAYQSIQRRVDALAVVHRHHYAELEENRGLELRSVIGELSANIRATAPDRASGFGITLEIEPFLVSQDVAVAVAFLITEIIELALRRNPDAQVRIAVRAGAEPDRAVLRVNSPALVHDDAFEELVRSRYGRVMEGLARQLRTRLHHDPLVGAYEATIAVRGRS